MSSPSNQRIRKNCIVVLVVFGFRPSLAYFVFHVESIIISSVIPFVEVGWGTAPGDGGEGWGGGGGGQPQVL